jgi:protein ImuA
MSGPERHLVVARLREEIRRLERRPARREGVIPCGIDGVDAILPGGGFPCGRIAELVGGPASGKTTVALALFASLGPDTLVAYVDGRGELHPPAAASHGVALSRLLVVRPPATAPPSDGRERPDVVRSGLWAAEALLASGAFAAVAIDLAIGRALGGADAVGRRLQSAAERGGAVGLGLGPGPRTPGALRLELAVEAGRIVARRAVTARGGGDHRVA